MKKKSQKKKDSLKPCSSCFGYGLWHFGAHVPMGPIDAGDGMPTDPCPECGASHNDYKTLYEDDKKYPKWIKEKQ